RGLIPGRGNRAAASGASCTSHAMSSEQLLCMFDDVNDLGMAFACGVRVLVKRTASPLLHDYVARQNLADYITGHTSSTHAVREVCELVLGLLGAFDSVVASRVAWDADYARYFAARQAI